MSGTFCLMLHSHIPYCRKSGVWPAGEEWLFEAMNECYIPLLTVLRRLHLSGIRPGITIGVVPILALQLSDGYMKARFLEYMGDKILRARYDLERFEDEPARRRVAEYWIAVFEDNVRAYVKEFHQDIPGTLRWLQDEGAVEVVTSAATHGFLPLLSRDSAVYAQVKIGVETYEKHFGAPPRGFWLPECAYRPAEDRDGRRRRAIDEWLSDFGVEWFIVEDVGIGSAAVIEDAKGCGAPTTDRGYRLPSGVDVFGRNAATGRQVWSAEVGYPSHPEYLEFHWQDPETGLRYHRVTGKDKKDIYDPDKARLRVARDAAHFVRLLSAEVKRAKAAGVGSPVIVSPYDTELFGHWWHEGPAFIEQVCRALAKKTGIAAAGIGDFADKNREDFQTIEMGPSTWGENGDFTVWQNPEHGWIWPLINDCCRQMEDVLSGIEAAGYVPDVHGVRVLKQMGRELLLMQGSDWPFLLYTEQAREYANQRFHHHHQRFLKLLWAARDLEDRNRASDHDLSEMEDIDGVWGEIEYRIFREREIGN
ncbi:MAG: glycoside hydrolase family 57 protein [Deltaproteobacteria bacterium]|nr:glycoside hydrolase family 57 protein [Candidatus Zymogenaceae bacterium]